MGTDGDFDSEDDDLDIEVDDDDDLDDDDDDLQHGSLAFLSSIRPRSPDLILVDALGGYLAPSSPLAVLRRTSELRARSLLRGGDCE